MRARGLRPAVLGVLCVVAAALSSSVPALGLTAHAFTGSPAHGLVDGRVYEQVSPVDKNASDAWGGFEYVQSAPNGEAVTFFSVQPLPGAVGAWDYPTNLSTRSSEGWSTQGLLPPAEPASPETVYGLTEDLSEAIVTARGQLAPGAVPGKENTYLRNSATRAYTWLAGPGAFEYVGASADDSRIFFEQKGQQLPSAAPGVFNLYEWHEARLSLAGVLPGGGAPAAGVVSARANNADSQGTVSRDGSRVFFTDSGNGQIYVRESGILTVPVSAGSKPAQWHMATPDGRYAFYTEGGALYRFDAVAGTREALTPGSAKVLGTLGASNDGAYVYYATDVTGGQDNIYEWHAGQATLIATVSGSRDETDWRERDGLGPKSSRVTPSGTTLLFTSIAQLGSYQNSGKVELYLFDAPSGRLTCVSCNPSGTAASSDAYLQRLYGPFGSPIGRDAFLERNLSSDGSRVFFQTEEALLPQDVNGQMDVYEWEDGHVHLISTGQSDDQSYFGDASSDGRDVFFFTRQSLVGQDQDNNADIYDARIAGGIASQNPVAPVSCSGEECQGATAVTPAFTAPASATFSGAGDLAPKPPAKAVKRAKAKRKVKPKRGTRGKAKRKGGRKADKGRAARRAGKAARPAGENESARRYHS